ncbi:MAG: tetratricopeptide repeat protein [Thermodesulfobacteriota bacterium]
MRKRYILAVLAISAVVAIGLHYKGFSGPFFFDSNHHLVERKHVYATDSLLHVVKTFPTRAVSMTTFYLGYRIHGMDPYSFRVENALLLAGTGAAIFWLISLLMEIPVLNVQATPSEKTLIAMAAAFMFVVHTVQVLVVLYVIQRMALMSCFFYVCCLIAYFSTRMGRFRSQIAGYSICAVLFLLALLSKENAITAPALILLAELTFFTRHARLSKELLLIFLIPVVFLAVVLVSVQMFFRFEGSTGVIHQITGDYAWTGYALHEVIMTQCRMLFKHLSIIAAPFAAHIALAKPVQVSTSIVDPSVTVVAVAGVIGVLVLGIMVLRRRPLAGFGILSCVLILVPESVVDPKLLCLQYRAVLPIVPFLLVVVDLAVMAIEWGRKTQRLVSVRVCLVAVWIAWMALTAVTTLTKAELWLEPVRLWADVVDGFPPEGTPHVEKFPSSISLNNLGTALQNRGRVEEALKAYHRALQIRPESAETHNNVGNVIQEQGRTEEAIPYFRRAIELKPQARQPYVNLGAALMTLGKFEEAKEQFETAVKLYPQHPIARANLGIALINLGRLADGETHLKKAIELDPNMALAYNQLGVLYQMSGNLAEAGRQFVKALLIAPDMLDARYNLADTLFRDGRFAQAAQHFKIVVERNPTDFEARNNLGVAYMELSRFPEAVQQFREVLKLRPDLDDAKTNLETALKAAEPAKAEP